MIMAQMENENTVLGVFADYGTAERVARDMVSEGISRDAIQVKSNFMTGAAGRSEYPEQQHEGGVSGFFRRLFGGDDSPSYTDHYAEAVRRGNAVVCVTASEAQTERAVEIMNAAGAVDIDRHIERFHETGYERHDPEAPPYSYDEAAGERERYRAQEETGAIPVVEEDLQIGKRVVRRGGVRVYSRIVEEPVSESIELREEHARVERRPVNRPAVSGNAEVFREQSIEVTEMAEEPVVKKRARVREEVVVGKETTRRTEQIRDKVRKTEIEVERLGDGEGLAQDYSSDFRRDWQERYANSGEAYETYEPAYQYGYRTASDPRYQGQSWSDVEDDLRTEYEQDYPDSAWERMKGAVRHGWEKVTGKR
jgi:uncharacterized protein (TIGR02271 family)